MCGPDGVIRKDGDYRDTWHCSRCSDGTKFYAGEKCPKCGYNKHPWEPLNIKDKIFKISKTLTKENK